MRFKVKRWGAFARRLRTAGRADTRFQLQNSDRFDSVQSGDAPPDAVDDPDLRHRARTAFQRSIASYDPPAAEEPDPETLRRLERAMQSMPRITREIFMAHRLDNYSYAYIAKVTGLSVRQVERQMATAIYKLCRHMDGDERTRWQRWRERWIERWFR
ncbi:sigma factor-like helix-turn-helix DNA-binding protein [Novosphingopyxis sp.]|uniref:sigma-70 region 4 domain-containing protein n=1 Tax=Novosphingopyxis sp. TaxID=2709690 RepID=UPI003B59C713